MANTRKQKSIDGVISLRDLLLDVASNPSNYADNEGLTASLKDQKRTAGLDVEFLVDGKARKTSPMSLNTLKNYSNEVLEGGFDQINTLRIGAVVAIDHHIEKDNEPNKRTKAGLLKKVSSLEEQLEAQRKINLILLQGISNSIHSIKNINSATKPEAKDKLCKDSIERLRAIVSLNAPPYNNIESNNVVNFNSLSDR